MPNSIFFQRRSGGFQSKKCHRHKGGRRTKNDPFLNMGFKHGKKVGGQKWDKNAIWVGFGRINKNTRQFGKEVEGSVRSISVRPFDQRRNRLRWTRNKGLDRCRPRVHDIVYRRRGSV